MEARLRLTSRCNLNCEYCFAKEFRNENSGDILLNDLNILARKLMESDITTLKIQGGEPTCHKQFEKVSEFLKDSGFALHLYTNGLFNNSFVRNICRNYKSVTINCNQLNDDGLDILSKNIDSLLNLGCNVMLGKTISNETSNVDGFLMFAQKFKDDAKIRFDASRPYIPYDGAFQKFRIDAHRVIDALIKAKLQGFNVEVDCCYPPCIFSNGEWKLLRRYLRGFWSKCTTIVDIAPNLAITSCFCGAQFTNLHVEDFSSLKEAGLFAEYIEYKMRFNTLSLPLCYTCQMRVNNICQGGCLGHKKTSLRYAGKEQLDEFRVYLADLCESGYNDIISSGFTLMSKCILLQNTHIDFDDLKGQCKKELMIEPDNPFMYAYIAGAVYLTGNYTLTTEILNDMPATDAEANFIKEKLLSKIGE